MRFKIKPHQAFGLLLKLSLTALVVELPVDSQAQAIMSRDRSKKPPAPPPEEFIKFERREPARSELDALLDAAVKTGVRPGTLGAIIAHESSGTWNAHIRPSKPGEPPVKVTMNGEVRGKTGSSALGIAQYTDATWLQTMYRDGEEIIAARNLDRTDPAATATIRSVNRRIEQELTQSKRPPSWNTFNDISDKWEKDIEVQRLLKLRADSDPKTGGAGSMQFYALGYDIRNYSMQLLGAGKAVNTTNIYVLHHSSLGDLRKILKEPDEVPSVRAAAVANNGSIYVRETEEGVARKTGAETYQTYASFVSDAHASAFERKHFGRDFGKNPDGGRLRSVKDAAGQPLQVRTDLIMPRLSPTEFQGIWRAPNQPVTDPTSLSATVAALERLGVDFGKQRPTDFNSRRLNDALSTFKQQVGLPNPDEGLDTATQRHLQLAVNRVDHYADLQRQQRELLTDSSAINLRQLGSAVGKLPKSDPTRLQAEQYVRGLKDELAEAGLLSRPPKGRPFDGGVDNRLLKAMTDFQRSKGLADTKGVVDLVTLGQLNGVDHRKLRTSMSSEPMSISASEPFNDIASQQRVQVAGLSAALQEPETATPPTAVPSTARVLSSRSNPQHS